MNNNINLQYNNDLLYKEEVYTIVSCAFEVLNTLGHGLLEKPYENALCVEFMARQIPYEQQRNFNIIYKNHKVGEFIPDLIAFGTIVIDMKTIDKITDLERGQILNYLKITGCKVGLILNFKHPILEWTRLVL
ncbi:MAG: GxxExxY protein [Victivallales bacterium]|nr:GxxExxY protein [Victivallales bacterium]